MALMPYHSNQQSDTALIVTCALALQLLLRKKAAEELKKEQERKAAERRRIIDERCGKPKNVDDANEGENRQQGCVKGLLAHCFFMRRQSNREMGLRRDSFRVASSHEVLRFAELPGILEEHALSFFEVEVSQVVNSAGYTQLLSMKFGVCKKQSSHFPGIVQH
jgi:hypothetical protein